MGGAGRGGSKFHLRSSCFCLNLFFAVCSSFHSRAPKRGRQGRNDFSPILQKGKLRPRGRTVVEGPPGLVFLAGGGDQCGLRPQEWPQTPGKAPTDPHQLSPLPGKNQQRVEVQGRFRMGHRRAVWCSWWAASAHGVALPFTKWQDYLIDGCCPQVLLCKKMYCVLFSPDGEEGKLPRI